MNRKTQILSVLFLSMLATFIFFYPVILNIGTHIPGFYSTDEPYGVIWSFWRLKFAYLHKFPASPINLIAYPFGIKVISLSFFPLWELIAKYIAIFSNEIIAYNTILLSTFILSGLTMYLLMSYLTKDTGVSIFAALIYAFSPYHLVRGWQHLGAVQIQWTPLYILFLFKLWESRKIKFAYLLGVVSALNFYYDLHYTYYMAIATCLFFLLIAFSSTSSNTKIQFIKLLSLSVLVGIILIFPASLPFWLKFIHTNPESASAYSLIRPFKDLFSQSARPLSYLLPFTEQPIFGKLTGMFVGSGLWGESLTEHNVFLGFIPMILAGVAFVKRKNILSWMKSRRMETGYTLRFFFFLILVAWFFSQPPWWDIFGFKLYMPSFFMYKLLPMFRAYVRFAIVVMLGVSVLSGFGLIYILNKFKSHRIRILILVLVCFLSLYEFWYNPKEHIIDLSKYPKAYDWLKEQKEDLVIAEYPLDTDGPNEKYRFYQTKHQKRIINGTLPGTFANQVVKTIAKLSGLETASYLKWLGVKYVFIHIDDYRNTGLTDDLEEIKKISQNPGLKFVTNFDEIDIYEVVVRPVEPPLVTMQKKERGGF